MDLDKLKEILSYGGLSSDLTTWGDMSEVWINDFSLENKGVSVEKIELIKLYVAAHLQYTAINKGGVSSKKIGEGQTNYRSPAADKVGLFGSHFGQMAIAMDSSDCLKSASREYGNSILFEVVSG